MSENPNFCSDSSNVVTKHFWQRKPRQDNLQFDNKPHSPYGQVTENRYHDDDRRLSVAPSHFIHQILLTSLNYAE